MQKVHTDRHKNKTEEKETQCSCHTTGAASVNKGTTVKHSREKKQTSYQPQDIQDIYDRTTERKIAKQILF